MRQVEFPQAVYDQIENIPDSLEGIDIGQRIDLRDEVVVTIDGDDAKDLDDGISLKKLDKWSLSFRGAYCRCFLLCLQKNHRLIKKHLHVNIQFI